MPKISQTSNNYANPYRPFPVRWFNRIGERLAPLGILDRLYANQLMDAAKKKTALSDFGEGFGRGEIFYDAFHELVDALNKDANLTPFGRFIQKTRLTAALTARLRIAALLKMRPEIREIDLGKILVIAGLQRTGTTTLHRLIAADPDMRALLSWEALNPLPLKGEQNGERNGEQKGEQKATPTKRIQLAKQAEKALAYMAPEFFAIHPVEFDAPEEDILLLDLTFMSQAPEATFHVPSYAKWLEKQNHQAAYEYLHRVLQILHWYQPKKNWVLKTPHHMEYLDVILKVFPAACIVQTHRDPQKTTGSFCSMVAHGRGVFSDKVDAKEVARHWTNKVERMMRLSIDVRKQADAARFVDVSYYDLLKNPIGEVQKIYAAAGIELTTQARNAMQATGEKNKQHRFGKHVYHLADFGLTEADIENKYAFYREHYQIPTE